MTLQLSTDGLDQSGMCDWIGQVLAKWCETSLGASHWVVLRWNQIENRIQFIGGSGSACSQSLESAWHDKQLRKNYFFRASRTIEEPEFIRIAKWVDPEPSPGPKAHVPPSPEQKTATKILAGPGMQIAPAPVCTGSATFPIGDIPFTVFFALPSTVGVPTIEQLQPAYDRVLGMCHSRCIRGRRELTEDRPPEQPTLVKHLVDKVFKAASSNSESARIKILKDCIGKAIYSDSGAHDFEVLLHTLTPVEKGQFTELTVRRLEDEEEIAETVDLGADDGELHSIAAFAAKKRVSLAIEDITDMKNRFAEKLAAHHVHPLINDQRVPIRGYFVAVPPESEAATKARVQLGLVNERLERFVCTGESTEAIPDIGRRLRAAERFLTLYHALRDIRLIAKQKEKVEYPQGWQLSKAAETPSGKLKEQEKRLILIQIASDIWDTLNEFWHDEVSNANSKHSPRTEILMERYCELIRKSFDADLAYFLRRDYPSQEFVPHGIALKRVPEPASKTNRKKKIEQDKPVTEEEDAEGHQQDNTSAGQSEDLRLVQEIELKAIPAEIDRGADEPNLVLETKFVASMKTAIGLNEQKYVALGEAVLRNLLSSRLIARRSGRTWKRYQSLDKILPEFITIDSGNEPSNSREGYSFDKLCRGFPWLNGWPFGCSINARPWGLVWLRWSDKGDPNNEESAKAWRDLFETKQTNVYKNTTLAGIVCVEAVASLYTLLRYAEDERVWQFEHSNQNGA